MTAMLDGIERLDRALLRAAEAVIVAALAAIFSIIVALVVLRYAFNSSIVGGNELVVLLFIYTTSLGAAVAIARKEHIAINFMVEKFPLVWRKRVEIASFALIAALNGVMIWYSAAVWIPLTGHFMMPALQLPQIYGQLSIPIGCALVLASCMFRIVLLLSGREAAGAMGLASE